MVQIIIIVTINTIININITMEEKKQKKIENPKCLKS